MTTINIILVVFGILLVAGAGIFEAVMDKLQFHYGKSIFKLYRKQQYWNPKLSWANKYKQDLKTPKFICSTTCLVFLTDAWHFFKFLRTLVMFVGLIIIGFNSTSVWFVILFTIIARILFGLAFQLFFEKVFEL